MKLFNQLTAYKTEVTEIPLIEFPNFHDRRFDKIEIDFMELMKAFAYKGHVETVRYLNKLYSTIKSMKEYHAPWQNTRTE